jgi:hypothetical protein
MTVEPFEFDDEWEEDRDWPGPDCVWCNDTGKVICDDGHYQHLGQDEMPCSCPMGMQWIGKLGPRVPAKDIPEI